VPDVTVCGTESLLVHVTVSPTSISIGLGAYALVVSFDDPAVMSAVTVAAKVELLLKNTAMEAIETPTTREK
jgi:hypothetical protein